MIQTIILFHCQLPLYLCFRENNYSSHIQMVFKLVPQPSTLIVLVFGLVPSPGPLIILQTRIELIRTDLNVVALLLTDVHGAISVTSILIM